MTSPQALYLQVPSTVPLRVPLALPAPKGVELCGYGPIPVVDGIAQLPPGIEAAAQSSLGSLATDLAARSADRDRALGLYLRMFVAASAARASWSHDHGDCAQNDTACQLMADQAASSAAAESRRALVRLAASTSDANAYALAISSCHPAIGESASGECAVLSHAQWAKIEPDNAVPWLGLAHDAEQRRDRSTFEAAMYRASKARYSDSHWDQISGLLASDAVAALSPSIQIGLAIPLLGIQAAFAFPNLQVVPQYCTTAAQADPNRAQTCIDLAATLVEHSRTAIEVLVGGRIVERVGWVDPRLTALRDEADAMRWQISQIQIESSSQEHILLSCESLQRFRRNMALQVQFGESGRVRQELAASGVTTTQAAERWRAAIHERAAQQSGGVKPDR